MSTIPSRKIRPLTILCQPNPILTANPNRDVKFPLEERIKLLISSMKDTLEATKDAVGLAAPQIGENLRIIVYLIPKEISDELLDPSIPGGLTTTVMINPIVISRSGRMLKAWERCLSIPKAEGEVSRRETIEVSYFDEEGQSLTKIANLFHARVLQHELDHINHDHGMLYPNRMGPIRTDENYRCTMYPE